MNLLDLAVRIIVDDQASQNISNIAGGIKSGLGTAAKVGTAAVGAMATATTAAGAAFAGAVGDVASYGDNIDKMSQKMGLSAEAYQEWDAVMQHSGTSMETMKASMKTLANAAETGSEAFDQLGISQEQIANMSQQELFEATIAALQNVEDETTRTYLAGKTLGRGATELGALLNTSAEDTQAMRDRIHELGGVMSDEAVKASAAYQDSLQDMQTAMDGLKNNMTAEFLPSITTVMDGLQEVFSGNYDEGLAMIGEGVSGTVDKMAEILPRITELGGGIIETLVTAISDNLPSIIDALVGVVSSLAQAFIDNMPTITSAIVGAIPTMLDAGLQLFMSLLDAIVDSLPAIIDGLTDALILMIDKLPEYLPKMLEAAGKLFLAIATAVVENLPEILAALGEAIEKLVKNVWDNKDEMLKAGGELLEGLFEAIGGAAEGLMKAIGDLIEDGIESIGNFIDDMLKVGGELIQGLVDGIVGAPADIGGALMDMVGGGVDAVKNFLGIASPSKLFRKFGNYTMEGFAKGIEQMAGKAERAMQNAAGRVYDAASGEVDIYSRFSKTASYAASNSLTGASNGIVINLNYNAGADANDMLRDIYRGVTQYRVAGVI